MNVGPLEIMVIMVVALLVFGPHRLPEVARQVGGTLRELRKVQDTVRGELDMVLHPEHGTSSSAGDIEPGDHTALTAGEYEATPDAGDTTSQSYDGADLSEADLSEAEWSDSDWSNNGWSDGGDGSGGPSGSDDRRFHGPSDSFS